MDISTQKFPTRAFATALLISVLLISTVVVLLAQVWRLTQHSRDVLVPMLEVRTELIRLDQWLLDSARLFALTRDEQYARRYASGLRQIREALQRSQQLRIERHVAELLATGHRLNEGLAAIEHDAIRLARSGSPEQALQLLESPNYRNMAQELSAAFKTLDREVDRQVHDSLERRGRLLGVALLTAIGTLVIVPVPWLQFRRALRRWRTSLQAAHEETQQAHVVSARAHARLDRLVESLEEGFFSLDRDCRLTYSNAAARAWTHIPLDQLVGRHLFDEVVPELKHSVFEEKFAQALEQRQPLVFEAFHEPRQAWLWVRIYPAEDGGVAALFSDVTERKTFEKMKDDFIGVVNHELRTPLTSVHGALKLLEGGVAGTLAEPVARLVKLASANAERMKHIIDDFLDIEKAAAGRMEFRLEAIDAAALLGRMALAHEAQALASGVQISVYVPENLALRADEQRIEQVLSNLFSNALKFAPRGSVVKLQAHPLETDWVRLSVTDHGPGIPEHFRGRIFQRFAQADMGHTRATGGSGLGLSIVKQLTERMHGRVSYESEPGRTTFHVDLPRVQQARGVPRKGPDPA